MSVCQSTPVLVSVSVSVHMYKWICVVRACVCVHAKCVFLYVGMHPTKVDMSWEADFTGVVLETTSPQHIHTFTCPHAAYTVVHTHTHTNTHAVTRDGWLIFDTLVVFVSVSAIILDKGSSGRISSVKQVRTLRLRGYVSCVWASMSVSSIQTRRWGRCC